VGEGLPRGLQFKHLLWALTLGIWPRECGHGYLVTTAMLANGPQQTRAHCKISEFLRTRKL